MPFLEPAATDWWMTDSALDTVSAVRPRFFDHEGRPLIPVLHQELEANILVQLRVMPKMLWLPYEKMLAIDPKRRREEDKVDPKRILAAYIAERLTRANWIATYPEHSAAGVPVNQRQA